MIDEDKQKEELRARKHRLELKRRHQQEEIQYHDDRTDGWNKSITKKK